ncbi:uncharacterized protein LOC125177708 [Hyalella azteca]|uniref:Uncharacterized protein LOC125177708 n=1 Tax=Hyalella azteca TaxID=294128 RepID=A0A979FG68_HYAAZ|nr:uncharacterized protein LOC125177708 [Hyalella azteca]
MRKPDQRLTRSIMRQLDQLLFSEAYRLWSCSQLLDFVLPNHTRILPCREMCYDVAQKCPYLLPSDKPFEFYNLFLLPSDKPVAGEPTFLCEDPEITGHDDFYETYGPPDNCYMPCKAVHESWKEYGRRNRTCQDEKENDFYWCHRIGLASYVRISPCDSPYLPGTKHIDERTENMDSSMSPEGRKKTADSRSPEGRKKTADSRSSEGRKKTADSRSPEGRKKTADSRNPEDRKKTTDSRSPEGKKKTADSRSPEGKKKTADSRSPEGKKKTVKEKTEKKESRTDREISSGEVRALPLAGHSSFYHGVDPNSGERALDISSSIYGDSSYGGQEDDGVDDGDQEDDDIDDGGEGNDGVDDGSDKNDGVEVKSKRASLTLSSPPIAFINEHKQQQSLNLYRTPKQHKSLYSKSKNLDNEYYVDKNLGSAGPSVTSAAASSMLSYARRHRSCLCGCPRRPGVPDVGQLATGAILLYYLSNVLSILYNYCHSYSTYLLCCCSFHYYRHYASCDRRVCTVGNSTFGIISRLPCLLSYHHRETSALTAAFFLFITINMIILTIIITIITLFIKCIAASLLSWSLLLLLLPLLLLLIPLNDLDIYERRSHCSFSACLLLLFSGLHCYS